MITAVVLEPRTFPRADAGRALFVRSLPWLVSAAVAGVVAEVILAASQDLALGGIADAVGSSLVEAEGEDDRLRAAAASARFDRAMLLVASHAPDAVLIEELSRCAAAARLLAEPATLVQRLFPATAPVVGYLVSTATLRAAGNLAALRRVSRAAPALVTRARSLL